MVKSYRWVVDKLLLGHVELPHDLDLAVLLGGGPCDYSVTPSPNWTRIFYFFGFGIGSRGTGFGTRA